MKLPHWHRRGEHEMHRLARDYDSKKLFFLVSHEPPNNLDSLVGAPELERLKALELLGALPASPPAAGSEAIPWKELAALPYPAAFVGYWPGGVALEWEEARHLRFESWEILSGEELAELYERLERTGTNRRIFSTPPAELLESRLTALYEGLAKPQVAPRRVIDGLFVGRAPLQSAEAEALVALGITHLFDLREPEEWELPGLLGKTALATLERHGVVHETFPMRAGELPDSDALGDLLLRFWEIDLAGDDGDARVYLCSRGGRGRVSAALVAWWADRQMIRGKFAHLELARMGVALELTSEALAAVNAFTLRDGEDFEGEGERGVGEQYPWEDIVACFGRQRAPRDEGGEFVATARARLLPEARPCPICGTPPERLRWFWFESPRFDPPGEFGAGGWMSACEGCEIQVDFESAWIS